jgi:AraC-like DNA-binding protein
MISNTDPRSTPAHAPLDPRFFFTVTVPPERFVGSAGSGWDGVLFTEGAARPSGEARHDHQVVMVQRWLTPNDSRPIASAGSWTIDAPGVRVCLPGDPEYGEWRGTPRSQFLFIAPERVEILLGKRWDAAGLTRWRERRHTLPFVDHVLAAMRQDLEAGYPAGPLTGDALLLALLTFLDARSVDATSPRRGALGRRLALVLEYIEANLARPLTLGELAALAGVGVRRFGSIFAAETGWSPHRYVLSRRIERAKAMMSAPELTLAQIAHATGFGDPSQFSRVFRQYTGQAPRAYRRR